MLCLAAGYLFGCFLTAEVVARCTAGESARQIGSGNPGMANIMTHLGKRAGLLELAGDVLKTAAACWFCWQLAPELRLTDIAQMVGYEDQSYFAKVFKRVTGSSPSGYRSGLAARSAGRNGAGKP